MQFFSNNVVVYPGICHFGTTATLYPLSTRCLDSCST